MRHHFQHQSPPLPKDASQHTAPLWYWRTQMQPQFSSDSPVVSQSPAEHGAIAAVLGKRRHVRSDARQRRPVSGGTEACQRHRLRVDVLQADACVPTWSATAGTV
jgi:hypothetical protein